MLAAIKVDTKVPEKPYYKYLHQDDEDFSLETIKTISDQMDDGGWGVLVVFIKDIEVLEIFPSYINEDEYPYELKEVIHYSEISKEVKWDRVLLWHIGKNDKNIFINEFEKHSQGHLGFTWSVVKEGDVE